MWDAAYNGRRGGSNFPRNLLNDSHRPQRSPPALRNSPTGASDMTRQRPLTLMLVQADPLTRAAVERLIQRSPRPLLLKTAVSLAEAAQRVRRAECDAILLDCTAEKPAALDGLGEAEADAVVLLVDRGPRESAARAIQQGACPCLVDVTDDRWAALLPAAIERVVDGRRKSAELRRSEQRYREVVETASEGIWVIDAQDKTLFVNQRMAEMLGRTGEELVGESMFTFVDQQRRAVMEEKHRRRRQGIRERYDFKLTHKDGSERWVIVSAAPLFDEKEQYAGALAMVTDITERRQAEDALQQVQRDLEDRVEERTAILKAINQELRREIAHRVAAEEEARRHLDQLAHVERLSTMGEMVSALAHELNQPLAAISNYAQASRHYLTATKAKDGGDAIHCVEQIAEQADRAAQIIRHLRTYTRRADSQRSALDLNELVRDLVVLLEVELRLHDVRLELELDQGLPLLAVDRIQIEQVILNLVHNAVEAMGATPAGRRRITIRTSCPAADRLELAVIDTGPGFQAADLDRLFEPFYTTKAAGMGLGLSISRSIVEAHGGKLEAEPQADCGTTFRVTFPVHREEGGP